MKIIVIVGGSCTGKSSLARELADFYGYRPVVTYTTRPRRDDEIDEVDYHFRTNKVFDQLVLGNFFVEHRSYDASFGYCQYGTPRDEFDDEQGYRVLVLDPFGAWVFKQTFGDDVYMVYLKADESIRILRAQERGDNLDEFCQRLERDADKFRMFERWNFWDIQFSKYESIESMAEMIDQESR